MSDRDSLFDAGLWQDANGDWWQDFEEEGVVDSERIGTTEEAMKWVESRPPTTNS